VLARLSWSACRARIRLRPSGRRECQMPCYMVQAPIRPRLGPTGEEPQNRREPCPGVEKSAGDRGGLARFGIRHRPHRPDAQQRRATAVWMAASAGGAVKAVRRRRLMTIDEGMRHAGRLASGLSAPKRLANCPGRNPRASSILGARWSRVRSSQALITRGATFPRGGAT